MIPGLSPPYPPLFFPIAPWLDQLPGHPDAGAVSRLAAIAGLRTESGCPLSFVAPQDDALGYERRIWEKGEVETRPDNLHDFFNALVWLTFPKVKGGLNARHIREMAVGAKGRGGGRDAMTHFDECGLVAVATAPSLLALLRGFQWKALFWERRLQVMEAMRFFVFGHATYEQLLAPFPGVAAKAVLYEVGEGWLARPLAEQLHDLDQRLAGDLAKGLYASPREFQPVPLLGIPGMTPASECPEYYDDTRQFRPGRRCKGV